MHPVTFRPAGGPWVLYLSISSSSSSSCTPQQQHGQHRQKKTATACSKDAATGQHSMSCSCLCWQRRKGCTQQSSTWIQLLQYMDSAAVVSSCNTAGPSMSCGLAVRQAAGRGTAVLAVSVRQGWHSRSSSKDQAAAGLLLSYLQALCQHSSKQGNSSRVQHSDVNHVWAGRHCLQQAQLPPLQQRQSASNSSNRSMEGLQQDCL